MSIDWWTLGLETVNVTILIWLLAHFFWRPVARTIADRRAAVAKTLSDAEHERNEAAKILDEAKATREEVARAREAMMAEARAEADTLRADLITKAKAEARALDKAEKKAIAAERVAAEKEWEKQSGQLAIDIAGRLAERLKGAAVRTVFLQWLVDAIAELPQDTKQSAAKDGATFEVVSAEALSQAEQTACKKRIAVALGGSPELTFKTDPALIAGLELRSPHLTVKNSWRADLDTIGREISREG